MRFLRVILAVLLFLPQIAAAQEFSRDLSIDPSGVQSTEYLLFGKVTRIYTTVQNSSTEDLFGVVKFYDEKAQKFIGQDQPVSVLSGKTDDVFVDWEPKGTGENTVSVRVIPYNPEGDDPSNNKVTRSLYVDVDSDGDGTGDQADIDDDNDGVPDREDRFPLNFNESADADNDGLGDNADPDDDNDGVPDERDLFPKDPNESADTDGDGMGDNADAFPNNPNEKSDKDNDGLGDNDDPDDENMGPYAVIETKDIIVGKDKLVTFSAIRSTDPDGEIVTYEWSFGDGGSAQGVLVEHKFKGTGAQNVTLKVTDDRGEYRKTTKTITVVYGWQSKAIILLAILLALLLLIHLLTTKKSFSSERRNLSDETDKVHQVAITPEAEVSKPKTAKRKTPAKTSRKAPAKKTQKGLPKSGK